MDLREPVMPAGLKCSRAGTGCSFRMGLLTEGRQKEGNMCNWCDNDIHITGADTKKYLAFMEKSQQDNLVEKEGGSSWGANWIGNLLLSAGEDCDIVCHHAETISSLFDVAARGSYEICTENEEEISIYAESAWVPCYGTFQYIAQKMGFDVDIEFFSSEPGCGIFVASDRSMTDDGEYYVDAYIEADKSPFTPFVDYPFQRENELVKNLQQALGTEETDVNNLISMINKVMEDINDGSYCCINKIEFVS